MPCVFGSEEAAAVVADRAAASVVVTAAVLVDSTVGVTVGVACCAVPAAVCATTWTAAGAGCEDSLTDF